MSYHLSLVSLGSYPASQVVVSRPLNLWLSKLFPVGLSWSIFWRRSWQARI